MGTLAPVAAALLSLCLVAVPAGRVIARAVRRLTVHDTRSRRALWLVLAAAFGLMAWQLSWGLAAPAWAADELLPGQVRELIGRRFADGWHDKYPLLHYVTLAIPLWPFEVANRMGLVDADGQAAHVAQLALMRLVSTLMGIAMLAGVWVAAAELQGPRRAIFAPLVLLLTPLTLYYGKTANLDMPFLCFFAWAIAGFVRIWTRGRRQDYLLLGVAAAAAVATKDQAYASLALLPVGVLIATMRRLPGHGPARLAKALVDRRLLTGAAAAVAAFALFHNAVFNLSGVVAHFRLLSTLGDLAIVPRTVAGYLDLTGLTAELFGFALGWPSALLAAAGIVRAAIRPERRWWLWLLAVPVSFHLTFTWVTLYVNDRYLFGGVLVLALFAGSTLGDLADTASPRGRIAARVAAVAALGYALLKAVSVNLMMAADARVDATAWLERQAAGTTVAVVGQYEPIVPSSARAVFPRASLEDVRALDPDFVVLNRRFAERYRSERTPDGRDLLAALENGSLGYAEVFRERGALPPWALLQYDPEFSRARESTWTNLDKINPEVVIYWRR